MKFFKSKKRSFALVMAFVLLFSGFGYYQSSEYGFSFEELPFFENQSPQPQVTHISPPSGVNVSGNSVMWQQVYMASGYFVYVNGGRVSQTSGTSFNLGGLGLPPGQHRIQVRAFYGNIESGLSGVANFNIMPPQPEIVQPQLITPQPEVVQPQPLVEVQPQPMPQPPQQNINVMPVNEIPQSNAEENELEQTMPPVNVLPPSISQPEDESPYLNDGEENEEDTLQNEDGEVLPPNNNESEEEIDENETQYPYAGDDSYNYTSDSEGSLSYQPESESLTPPSLPIVAPPVGDENDNIVSPPITDEEDYTYEEDEEDTYEYYEIESLEIEAFIVGSEANVANVEQLVAAVNNVNVGTINVTSAIAFNQTLNVARPLTINGSALTFNGSGTAITVASGGTLALQANLTGTNRTGTGVNVANASTFILAGGNISNFATGIVNSGLLTLSGGTVTNNNIGLNRIGGTVSGDVATIVTGNTTNDTSVSNVTVTFNVGGVQTQYGNATFTRSLQAGTTFGVNLPTLSASGFTFLGWRTGPSGTGVPFNSDTVVNANTNVYAHWSGISGLVTISFNANSGTLQNHGNWRTITVAPGQSLANAGWTQQQFNQQLTPWRTSYTFNGWFISSTNQWFNINTPVHHNITVNAQWSWHGSWWSDNRWHDNWGWHGGNVTLNFNPRGGTFSNYSHQTGTLSRQIQRGRTVQNHFGYSSWGVGSLSRLTPTRNNYDFVGWYIGTTNTRLTGSSTFNSTTTLNARWEPRGTTSTITFDVAGGTWPGGGTSSRMHTVRRNRNISNNGIVSFEAISMNPTRSGFRFDGWENASTGARFTISTNVSQQNLTVQARWIANQRVDITFNAQGGLWQTGGAANRVYSIPRGSTVNNYTGNTLPNFIETPTRQGYTFAGWFIGTTNNQFTVNTTVNNNTSVNARWVAGVPTVTAPVAQPAQVASPFTDVATTAWYFDYVMALVNQGVFYSTAPGEFSPNSNMTRAMQSHLMLNIIGDHPIYNQMFVDVNEDAWYFGSVNWVASHGLIDAYGEDLFNPNGYITNGELAEKLLRFANTFGVADVEQAYTYYSQNNAWEIATQLGLLPNLSQNDNARRYDVAVAFSRLLNLVD